MATSGSNSFTMTTNQIVTLAMKYIGKIGENDPISDEEYNDCVTMLNAMVKQWMLRNDFARGIKMWQRTTGFLFLSSVTGIYTLGSVGGTGLSRWTNNFVQTTSAGNNAASATVINVATVTAAQANMQPDVNPTTGAASSQTGPISAGQYIGIQLDNGYLHWTTVVSVSSSPTPTVTITNAIPHTSNNSGNAVFAFTTIATPPQVVETMSLFDQFGNSTFIEPLIQEQYDALASNQATGGAGTAGPQNIGDPVAAYYESHLVGNNGQGYGLLKLDVGGAQNTAKYIRINYLTEIQDFVNPGDEMFFPKEWAEVLYMGLAKRISPMFNAPWTPVQESTLTDSVRYARQANARQYRIGFKPGDRGGKWTSPRWV